ncbi:MAG: hypothetical protein GW839_10055 [Flavobacteriales bacterium]|nr:hypothetical protein [Flavobacteriales bacterium]NCQ11229.1 hypothetical protein [Bacteroidota bacterium]
MKNTYSKYLLLLFMSCSYLTYGQCQEDPKVLEMINRRDNVPRFSNDGSYEAFELCRKYYYYVCLSKMDYYEEDGEKTPVTEYDAKKIEDAVRSIIDSYNQLGNKKCGELKPVTAKYRDSISNRKDMVVGYWVNKDNIGGRVNYTDFYFGNDQDFKMSLYPYKKQKAAWKKTGDNTYAITFQSYSDFYDKWNNPEYSTFTINPSNCSATYSFKDYQGNTKTSTWYFKGRAFNLYGKTEEEILKPENCKL